MKFGLPAEYAIIVGAVTLLLFLLCCCLVDNTHNWVARCGTTFAAALPAAEHAIMGGAALLVYSNYVVSARTT